MVALLERDRELGVIRDGLAKARGGDGRSVLVEGPSGIGKSALLLAARTQARDAGFRVLSAAGGELETDFPYGMVRQLFEPELASEPEGEISWQALRPLRGRCWRSGRRLGPAKETVTASRRYTGSTG